MQTTALITGSSKGIGRAIAQSLATAGYFVYVTYLTDKAGAKQTLHTIIKSGGKGRILKLDVCSETSVRALMQAITSEHGHLDVLVCNAATEVPKNLEDVTFAEWALVTRTKIDGCFLCTKHALPLLKNGSNKNVIFITSRDGEKPQADYPGYCIGTAGIIAFTKAMSAFLPKYGIRVNAVSPGTTRTPLWQKIGANDNKTWRDFAKRNPMGRVPTVSDVANTVLMLVEDPSKYLNGNLIYVDGGMQHVD